MVPYKALYDRRCCSLIGWFETYEAITCGMDFLHDSLYRIRVIHDRLRATQSRKKTYANYLLCSLRFRVGDCVFLSVSPMRGVTRFGRKGMLIPRYIGPFEIIYIVGEVPYELVLPQDFDVVHPIFHVSILRKYILDHSQILRWDSVLLDE